MNIDIRVLQNTRDPQMQSGVMSYYLHLENPNNFDCQRSVIIIDVPDIRCALRGN